MGNKHPGVKEMKRFILMRWDKTKAYSSKNHFNRIMGRVFKNFPA